MKQFFLESVSRTLILEITIDIDDVLENWCSSALSFLYALNLFESTIFLFPLLDDEWMKNGN